MIINDASIAVRSRSVLEIYDLALLVCRRYGMQLLALTVIGMLPWLLLNWWLLGGTHADAGWGRWWPLLLLMAAQGPFATAPLTAFLGAAMFTTTPSVRRALKDALIAWRSLLLFGLWRGFLTLFVLTLLWYPTHAVEVVMLERQPLGPTWQRAVALRRVDGSVSLAHLALAVPLLIAGLVVMLSGFEMAWGLLLHADPWLDDAWSVFNPGHSLAPHLSLWFLTAYLAVVRFLVYLDLRTRHEGWELGLLLKRAAAHVEAGA